MRILLDTRGYFSHCWFTILLVISWQHLARRGVNCIGYKLLSCLQCNPPQSGCVEGSLEPTACANQSHTHCLTVSSTRFTSNGTKEREILARKCGVVAYEQNCNVYYDQQFQEKTAQVKKQRNSKYDPSNSNNKPANTFPKAAPLSSSRQRSFVDENGFDDQQLGEEKQRKVVELCTRACKRDGCNSEAVTSSASISTRRLPLTTVLKSVQILLILLSQKACIFW